MELHYNYVYFNNPDLSKHSYTYICAKDLESLDGVNLVSFPLEHKSNLVRTLFLAHRSKQLNKYFSLPLKSLWYPYYFENTFIGDKPVCFVISDRVFVTRDYIKYLKKNYPGSRFVIVHRDLMKYCRQCDNADLYGDPIIDIEMSYDKGECQEYGMEHFDEIESKIDIPIDEQYPLSDVYFAGLVKDRLPKLMEAYHLFTEAGLKVKYYLTGVAPSERIPYEGIQYADKPMLYYDMLYQTVNSRCVLEINQEGATGLTSRFLEAVMYNKRLVTNNVDIKDSKFYNPSFMQVVKKMNEINPKMIKNTEGIDYHYDGSFSPIHLIEKIDNLLVSRYGR